MSNAKKVYIGTLTPEVAGMVKAAPDAYFLAKDEQPQAAGVAWEAIAPYLPMISALVAKGWFDQAADQAEASDLPPIEYLQKWLDSFKDLNTMQGYVPPQEVLQNLGQNKRVVGTAQFRIKEAVDKLMAQGFALTGAIIFKGCGSNRAAIRKWMQANADLIAEYHKKIGCEEPNVFNRGRGDADV